MPKLPELNIWKTIKVGDLCGDLGLREALRKGGVLIDVYAESVVGANFRQHDGQTLELDLVKASVRSFGIGKSAPLVSIYAHAAELGLQPCPAETGPQLRLQYLRQPSGERLFIAMRPVPCPISSFDFIFIVECVGGRLWLRCEMSDDGYTDDEEFVFVLPQR